MATDDAERPPRPVLAAYGLEEARVQRIAVGLINDTFLATHEGSRVVVQRLHPIFDGTVNLDIDAVTAHVEQSGLATPRPLRTRDRRLWVELDGRVWRALTFLEGRVASQLSTPAMAREAGALVGRFHAALHGFEHVFHFRRPDAHDTRAHLARLRGALQEHQEHRHIEVIRPVAEAILDHGETLERVDPLPTRIVHGDLKLSNMLFDEDLRRAVALIDLDTIAHGTLDAELGDALRSWCNPAGEDAAEAALAEDLFAAAVQGYAAEGGELVRQDEIRAIVPGTERIALELAARFCHDALAEQYFGWNAERYASPSDHHQARARSQLALARSTRRLRPSLDAIVREAFSARFP